MSFEHKIEFAELAVDRTIRAYEKIASDFAETWFSDGMIEPMLDRFLNRLEPPGDVLDAGCGPGRDVLAMRRRGVEAVGIDLSVAMLTEAQARVDGAIFRLMDFRQIRYPSETFAGVWSCASLHHMPSSEAERALREFARVLGPGGLLGVAVEEGKEEYFDHLNRYRRLYTSADLRSLLARTGFVVEDEYVSYTEKGTSEPKRPKRWLQVLARKPPSCSTASISPGCLFCRDRRFETRRKLGHPGSGSILWGDDDLFVIPDIAPLMEGHLLMVTTGHHICVGSCPQALISKVRRAQQVVRRVFRDAYNSPTLFLEHGPARSKEAGACIEHAHWHCLPASLSPRPAIERFARGEAASVDSLCRFYEEGRSYLYVEESPDHGWVYPVDLIPCQFFRQTVVSLAGGTDWRWQTSCGDPVTQHRYRHTLKNLLPFFDKLTTGAVAND
jgi:ubiquinone/menaquinone biosynthesis C-methylase UbiE/diadenosine tetraphosphate (Ap4A) HIT family hydrolase